MHVAGAISQPEVSESLAGLNEKWKPKNVEFPALPEPTAPETSQVYFYDVPDAKQSVLMFGYPALAATDADYYPATLLNYRLGGGGFASRLTQELREGKGYTYGIRSGFSGSATTGEFVISSGVRSNVTYEASELVRNIVQDYGENYSEDDLEITKGYMIKSNARAFETLSSKLNMLTNISSYGYADDYAQQREAVVKGITVEEMKALSEKYLNPDKMTDLVVGDAATQMDKLEELGYGKPVLIEMLPAIPMHRIKLISIALMASTLCKSDPFGHDLIISFEVETENLRIIHYHNWSDSTRESRFKMIFSRSKSIYARKQLCLCNGHRQEI